MCRPVVLEKNRQILCHHDDDSLPGVAFTVLSLNGKVKQRFQIPQDLLVLKISADESRIALGMVKGRIWILDPTFKKIADRRVDGEIVDLSLASGPQPAGAEWSALVNVNGLGQQLIAMNPSGKLRWQQTLEAPHQQIELSEDGSLTAIYGNGPKGQLVSLLGTPAFGEGRLTLLWSYRAPRYADYNQRIDFSGEDIVLGFEEVTERTRHSHVVALQRSGQLNWDIPIQSEEGAYLYARGMTSKSGLLVLGTDDGRLTAYEVQR
jgi:outer membrane protein assembly factor BamB